VIVLFAGFARLVRLRAFLGRIASSAWWPLPFGRPVAMCTLLAASPERIHSV